MAAVDPAVWLNGIFTNILNKLVWPIFLGLVIIMFIYAGYLYLTAQGDSSKVATANKAVIFAIIGIVLALVSFSVVGIIRSIIIPSSTATSGSVPLGGTCTTNANCSSAAPNCVSGICQI